MPVEGLGLLEWSALPKPALDALPGLIGVGRQRHGGQGDDVLGTQTQPAIWSED